MELGNGTIIGSAVAFKEGARVVVSKLSGKFVVSVARSEVVFETISRGAIVEVVVVRVTGEAVDGCSEDEVGEGGGEKEDWGSFSGFANADRGLNLRKVFRELAVAWRPLKGEKSYFSCKSSISFRTIKL